MLSQDLDNLARMARQLRAKDGSLHKLHVEAIIGNLMIHANRARTLEAAAISEVAKMDISKERNVVPFHPGHGAGGRA